MAKVENGSDDQLEARVLPSHSYLARVAAGAE